jgi:hypothetical protein
LLVRPGFVSPAAVAQAAALDRTGRASTRPRPGRVLAGPAATRSASGNYQY